MTIALGHYMGIKSIFKHEQEIDRHYDQLLVLKSEESKVEHLLSNIVFIDDFF